MTALAAQPLYAETDSQIRVPAEWEPQEAIWLQWPGPYEKAHESAFAAIAAVIVQYETLHVLCDNEVVQAQAKSAIENAGVDPGHHRIVWHIIANDSAWMRDNGPVFVLSGGTMRVQDWKFNAWGGAFGESIPYAADDAVPRKVAEYLGMPVDHVDIVHERGNLEFNGKGAVIANWSTLGDDARNPGYSRERAADDFRRWFGVDRIVFIEGIPKNDLTKGHVDGIARFIDPDTVVVPRCTEHSSCRPGDGQDDAVYEAAAAAIEAAGFTVVRDPIQGSVEYGGMSFDANYANWLVGNGFVLAVGFGDPALDGAARKRLEAYFPGRDVHIVEMLSSWASGGGVHCHTNDQPALALLSSG